MHEQMHVHAGCPFGYSSGGSFSSVSRSARSTYDRAAAAHDLVGHHLSRVVGIDSLVHKEETCAAPFRLPCPS
ncbi:hypothetical protein HRW07_19750 [Streptomyces lunaelactis]|nr:hypothetical protein [Streptomyces lunaelactis]